MNRAIENLRKPKLEFLPGNVFQEMKSVPKHKCKRVYKKKKLSPVLLHLQR